MTVQTQSTSIPANPAVGGPGHTADHATIASLLAALQASVASLQGTGPAFLLAGGNTSAIPGSATNLATVTVQPVNRDGSPDILDIYYGSQKIFSLNGYGEPRVTAAALTHVAEIIYVLSGQTADAWQVLSSALAVLARVGPDGSASFAGPVSRQVGGAPAAWQHPALLNGWAAYAGRTFCVKLTNDNMVQVTGQLVPGQVSDGTTVAVLPSGHAPLYRPEAITLPLGRGYFEAGPSGNLNVYYFGSASGLPGGHVKVSSRFPLDAR
jgi:hypothetical protein